MRTQSSELQRAAEEAVRNGRNRLAYQDRLRDYLCGLSQVRRNYECQQIRARFRAWMTR